MHEPPGERIWRGGQESSCELGTLRLLGSSLTQTQEVLPSVFSLRGNIHQLCSLTFGS